MSESDIAYLRALRKATIFQQLTDSVSPDYSDDVVVDLLQKDEVDVDPILDKAKSLLKDIDNIMIFELDDNELSTSTSNPSKSIALILTDAGFKLWFIILLIFFVFISFLIFHFFCIAKKNVTRRNSTDKSSGETTTIEMSSEEIEMEEKKEESVIHNF